MRWRRRSRVMGMLLISLALLVYVLMMGEMISLLWPYRDHLLVRVVFAFLTGGHIEDIFLDTGAWL